MIAPAIIFKLRSGMSRISYEQLTGFFEKFSRGKANAATKGSGGIDAGALRLFLSSFGKMAALARASGNDLNLTEGSGGIDAGALRLFLSSFGKTAAAARESRKNLNMFEVCRIGRNEIRNCSVLAWLLDENGSHGLGPLFLRGILEKCGAQVKMPSPPALEGGYATRTELCPNGDNSDRVDIVCDGRDFLLYIEVKIDSFEHTGQTERYFAKMEHNAGAREKAIVFISPDTPPANPNAGFVRWRDCADVLDSLAADEMRQGAGNLAGILRQYADFVRKF